MLCQKCNHNEATTYITENINGIKREVYLCEECAKKEGLNIGFTLPSMISSLFSGGLYQTEEKRCPICNTSFREFSKSGRLGCAECYKTFENELRPLLLRVHKGSVHKGSLPSSIPKKQTDIDALKAQLKAAIESENFEQAAVLRDKIKEEEGKNE